MVNDLKTIRELPVEKDLEHNFGQHFVCLLVRFFAGNVRGYDPLANYECHHPSNPHSQPIQQPCVKRTHQEVWFHHVSSNWFTKSGGCQGDVRGMSGGCNGWSGSN